MHHIPSSAGFSGPKLYTSALAAILYVYVTQTTPTNWRACYNHGTQPATVHSDFPTGNGACRQDCNASRLDCVHGVPYCVLECGIIVRYKWAMCFVGVNLRQCWHCCANLRSCLCDFSLSAEELSGTFEERCTAEWVQSTYTTSAWTCLVLLGYFCTIFPLSQKFHSTCAYKFVYCV